MINPYIPPNKNSQILEFRLKKPAQYGWLKKNNRSKFSINGKLNFKFAPNWVAEKLAKIHNENIKKIIFLFNLNGCHIAKKKPKIKYIWNITDMLHVWSKGK